MNYTIPLFKLDSHGSLRTWAVDPISDGDTFFVTRSGVVGGTITVKEERVKPVKKQTQYEALVFNATSKWNKKLQKGGMTPKDAVHDPENLYPISPTLATRYDETKHWREESIQSGGRMVYGTPTYFAQHKYDGVLCIATWVLGSKCAHGVELHSRGREAWPHADHVRMGVERILSSFKPQHRGGFHLVGELYIHGTPLEQIISIVRWKDGLPHTRNDQLRYIVYDIADPPGMKLPYTMRRELLSELFSRCATVAGIVELAPIIGMVTSHSEAKELLLTSERDGYEGIVLRHPDMRYHRKLLYRNPLLLKYKSFEDEEVTVVGAKRGENSHEGCVIWVVKLDDESKPQFTVTPTGELEERKRLWLEWQEHPERFIGKRYTIRFQQRNSYGIPKFANGIGFRPSCDMDQR